MIRLTPLIILAGIVGGTTPVFAEETAVVLRQGVFREVTDSETDDYKVYSMNMSADGGTIAFMTGPRDEFLSDTLRVMNSDGSNQRIIAVPDPEDNRSYPLEVYDISDDGSTVVYSRRVANNGSQWLNEIRAFDTTTNTDSLVVAELAHLSFNESSSRPISHEQGNGTHLLTVSGNGQVVYFGNAFGPVGSGNDNAEPDGDTIYRAEIGSGEATKVISERDLSGVPDINVNASQVFVSEGLLATNDDGSVLVVPIGGGGDRPSPRSMLRIDAAKGGGASVIVNVQGETPFTPDLTGPELSSDGTLLVFANYDDVALPDGVLLMNSDGSGDITVLDEDTADRGRPTWPRISLDGSVVTVRSDLGGSVEPSIRWIPTDGSDIRLVSGDDTIRPYSRFAVHSISADGQRVALMGGVRSVNRPPSNEIIVFDWVEGKGLPTGVPLVESVVADGSFTLPLQPSSSTPEVTERFSYTTSGEDLGLLQSFALNGNADHIGIGLGIGTSTDIVDDGTFDDEVAGDGIYNDTSIWASSDDTVGTYTGRAAITSGNGTASFVEYPIVIRDPIPPLADFTADTTSGQAPLLVTFTATSTGDANFSDWDFTNNGSFNVSNTTQPVEHTYSEAGVYSVRMRARGFGNEDEAVKAEFITVMPSDEEIEAIRLGLLANFETLDTDLSGGLTLEEARGEYPELAEITFNTFDRDASDELRMEELLESGEGEGGACWVGPIHTADQNGDSQVGLSDLLRLIQFFNSSGFGCENGTEDGYAPNDLDQQCCPHDTDYNGGPSWTFELTELLRAIQFFNTGGYNYCPANDTEDGYCTGLP